MRHSIAAHPIDATSSWPRSSSQHRHRLGHAVPFLRGRRAWPGLSVVVALWLDGGGHLLRAQRLSDRHAGAPTLAARRGVGVPSLLCAPRLASLACLRGGASALSMLSGVARGPRAGAMVGVCHVHAEPANRLRPQHGLLARLVVVRGGTFLSAVPIHRLVVGAPARRAQDADGLRSHCVARVGAANRRLVAQRRAEPSASLVH
mmetsp:Transcript_1410/g.4199  ORF Transcript_1410/g.4199 Transcript_1410/m.4199 type:complete len:204 (+) Transcript_1410:3148-3759(+)